MVRGAVTRNKPWILAGFGGHGDAGAATLDLVGWNSPQGHSTIGRKPELHCRPASPIRHRWNALSGYFTLRHLRDSWRA